MVSGFVKSCFQIPTRPGNKDCLLQAYWLLFESLWRVHRCVQASGREGGRRELRLCSYAHVTACMGPLKLLSGQPSFHDTSGMPQTMFWHCHFEQSVCSWIASLAACLGTEILSYFYFSHCKFKRVWLGRIWCPLQRSYVCEHALRTTSWKPYQINLLSKLIILFPSSAISSKFGF